jgi:hypothetical protein
MSPNQKKGFYVAAFRSPKNSGSSSRIAVCKVMLLDSKKNALELRSVHIDSISHAPDDAVAQRLWMHVASFSHVSRSTDFSDRDFDAIEESLVFVSPPASFQALCV